MIPIVRSLVPLRTMAGRSFSRAAFAPSHPFPLRTAFVTRVCLRAVPRHFSRPYVCAAAPTLSSSGNGLVAGPVVDDVGFEEGLVVDPLPLIDEPSVEPALDTALEPTLEAAEEPPEGMGPLISDFRVSPVTIERLAKNGISRTTEVQAGTFDLVFEGKDIIAKSRTGTGKTLAFALPLMERLATIKKERRSQRGDGPGAIVLAPTRELAKQVAREMLYIGEGLGLSVECFYGGSAYGPQEGALRRGLDIVVGTPGRIMDHLDRGNLKLENISFAVLDEADEMLSMGFAQDVESIFETLPPKEERQVILFSATVPRWVKNLASQFQKDEVVTFDAVTTGSMASTTVRHCAVRVPEREEARASLLADIIAVHSRVKTDDAVVECPSRAIVFTQTKREADELATSGALDGCGAAVLHGDVSQRQREVTLSQFRQGQFQVLVATDVAARGLDISGVDVVVQYRVPNDTESYVHRAGRTGRAGKSGTAVVMYSDREWRSLRNLERECKIKFELEAAPAPEAALEAAVDVALGNVGNVDARVTKHLLSKAEGIINMGEGSVETIAAILAIAGRRIRLEDRSILSGEKGMRTLKVTGDGTFELSPSIALRFLSELGKRVGSGGRVGLIRVCRDGSAVVDIESESAEKLIAGSAALGEKAELKLTAAVGVPALKDQDRRRDGGRFDRGGGRYAGRNSSSGGRFGRGQYRGGGGERRGSSRFREGGSFRDGGRRESYSRDGGYGSGGGYSGGGRREFRGRDGGGSYRSRNGADSYNRGDGGGGGGRGRRNADFLSDDF